VGRVGHEQGHSLGQPRVETPRRLAKRIRASLNPPPKLNK